jgi:hypothetical protein
MTVSGTPKFNALTVAKLDADFLRPTISLKSTAAFVDEGTGHTHGWTEGAGDVWSDATMKKLDELKKSMEEDLAARHFSGISTTSSPNPVDPSLDQGLSEYLGDDTPSI